MLEEGDCIIQEGQVQMWSEVFQAEMDEALKFNHFRMVAVCFRLNSSDPSLNPSYGFASLNPKGSEKADR